MQPHVCGNETDHDHRRIDIEDSSKLRFWAKELHVDERTLRSAVKAAGPRVEKVREYLRTSQCILGESRLSWRIGPNASLVDPDRYGTTKDVQYPTKVNPL